MDFNTDLGKMRKGRSVEDLDRQRMAELKPHLNRAPRKNRNKVWRCKIGKIKTFELDR